MKKKRKGRGGARGSVEQRDVSALQLGLANLEVGTLIDVRGEGEFESGHVPGARNIPLGGIARYENELDRSQPVWLICKSGARSAQAAGVLSGQGFDVIDVKGGTAAWRRAGYPIEPEGADRPSLFGPLILSLTLGLAPFVPEPHLVGKLRWLAGGAVGMTAGDWFDLLMHGTPWLWLAWTLLDRLRRPTS